MRQAFRPFTALAAGLLLGGLAATAQAVDVDVSEPRATMMSMVNAMREGDAAALKKTVDLRDERTEEFFDAIAPLIASSGKLATVMEDKFGDAPAMQGQGMTPKTYREILDASEVETEGDSATIKINQEAVPEEYRQQFQQMGQAGMPDIELVKADGDWLLRPKAIGIEAAMMQQFQGPQKEQMQSMFSAMADATRQVTSQVEAGDFESAQQAQQALQQQMMRVMMEQQQQMQGGGMGN